MQHEQEPIKVQTDYDRAVIGCVGTLAVLALLMSLCVGALVVYAYIYSFLHG